MGLDFIGFAYAASVAAGGYAGYAKAGSIPSLGAGLVFGSLLGLGAYHISQNAASYGLSLGTSIALGGMMGYRWMGGGKFMPAGLVCLMSAAMVGKLLVYNVVGVSLSN